LGKFIDLIGQRFERLVVIERVENTKTGKARWKCLCDCGNYALVSGTELRNGHTKSCGCLHKDVAQKRIKNLVGKKFNRLLVIEKNNNKKNKRITWNCLCDCGNYVTVNSNNLISGNTKSCGCLNDEARKKGYSESAFNLLFNRYKVGAQKRNFLFELNEDFVRKITKEKCFYCGCDPTSISKSNSNNGNYIYNGIDRVDNALGYIINNVVPCCETCNRMKLKMGYKEFLDHVEKIQNYQKEKNV